MWSGAQSENKNGWVIAVIWSLGVTAIVQAVNATRL